jgi:hypothetical protein
MTVSAKTVSCLLQNALRRPMSPELWPKFMRKFTQVLGVPKAAILYQHLEKERYGPVVAKVRVI